jgi:hypothetical protein
MIKSKVEHMIDNEILGHFERGAALVTIISELQRKTSQIKDIIDRDKIDISPIYPALVTDVNIDELPDVPKRLQYFFHVITHSLKRIEDIKWIILNKKRFPLISNSEVFKLLKLRDKLSKEKALPF